MPVLRRSTVIGLHKWCNTCSKTSSENKMTFIKVETLRGFKLAWKIKWIIAFILKVSTEIPWILLEPQMWTITQIRHKLSRPWLRASRYVGRLYVSDMSMEMHYNLNSFSLNKLSCKIHHQNSEPGPLLPDPHSFPSTSFRRLLTACFCWLLVWLTGSWRWMWYVLRKLYSVTNQKTVLLVKLNLLHMIVQLLEWKEKSRTQPSQR